MKIKELIEELSKLDPELMVVLSKDSEGNDYGELRAIDNNSVINSDNEVHPHHLTSEMKRSGWSKEDLRSGDDTFTRCVVLWPLLLIVHCIHIVQTLLYLLLVLLLIYFQTKVFLQLIRIISDNASYHYKFFLYF